MNRRLLLGERIMCGNTGVPSVGVFTAKIRGRFTAATLRDALAGLQAKHPLLRAGIVMDKTGWPCFVSRIHVPEIPVRTVERQAENQWEKETEAEWKVPFDTAAGPLMRVVWLQSDDVSDLMLVCHRAVCDGTSFVTLMRELLALLDDPEKEPGLYTAFNSLHDIIPARAQPGHMATIRRKILSRLANAFLCLLPEGKPPAAGRDYMIHWKLSRDASDALIRGCIAVNTSVEAALCTAFLTAFGDIRGSKACNSVVCPADIRAFVPAVKQDTLFAFMPIARLTMDESPNDSFWAKAQSLGDALSERIDRRKVYKQLAAGEYVHSSADKMIRYLQLAESGHDLTFFFMGRPEIPERYHSFGVETVYSPPATFPWRNPNLLSASMFRGQVDFSFMSNDHSLRYAEALLIKERAMRILLEQTILPTFYRDDTVKGYSAQSVDPS